MNNFILDKENLNSRLDMIDELKSFLVTAPKRQEENQIIQSYHLPTLEVISCIQWQNSFFMTGTDIVRTLIFRFHAFGRPVIHLKKFEEGIFSDLRNLKPGTDAILEEPKSSFLELLFKHNCIRTQKKQKVFYWHAVPHDRLFLDALERDLKREKLKLPSTSKAIAEPAIKITLDQTQAMYDEFRKTMVYELNLESLLLNQDEKLGNETSQLFGQFSLFEGSPTYKQRRRRITSNSKSTLNQDDSIKKNKQRSDNSRYFDCPLVSCDKVFKRLEHMKRHLRTHTLERPYLCDLCGKRFSRSDNLAQHKKTHQHHKKRFHKQQGNTKPYTSPVNHINTSPSDSSHSPSSNSSIKLENDLFDDLSYPLTEDDLNSSWDSDWQKLDWNHYHFMNHPSHFLLTPTHTTVNSPIIQTITPDALLQH